MTFLIRCDGCDDNICNFRIRKYIWFEVNILPYSNVVISIVTIVTLHFGGYLRLYLIIGNFVHLEVTACTSMDILEAHLVHDKANLARRQSATDMTAIQYLTDSTGLE